MTLGRLLDALSRRHRELLSEAAALRRLLAARSGADDRLFAVFEAFADALSFHVQREERFLFPALRALEGTDPASIAAARSAVRRLGIEHAELNALEARLREMTHQAGEIAPRLQTFLAAYAQHDEVEDKQLGRLVEELLANAAPRRSP